MTRLARVTLTVTLLALTACGSKDEEPEYAFGAPEMKAAAGGDWTGTLSLTGASPTTYQLHLDYQAPGSQPMCGSRTLTSPACITVSGMAFVGVMSSADKAFDDTPTSARFEVFGETLVDGHLSIVADTRTLSASYSKAGFADGQVTDNGSPIGTFTMTRP